MVDSKQKKSEPPSVDKTDAAPEHDPIAKDDPDMPAAKSTTNSPAFQFYPESWFSSSRVQRMSHIERGIYIDLLAYCWLENGLPTDLSQLARMVRVPAARFARLWSGPLSECFFERHGRLLNARQERERKKQAKHREEKQKAALASWESRRNADALQTPTRGDASAMLSVSVSVSDPVSDPVSEKAKEGRAAAHSDSSPPVLTFPTIGAGPTAGAVADALVSSPPYEGSLQSNLDGTDASFGMERRRQTGGRIVWGSNADGSRSATGYSDDPQNIGTAQGDTFWAAALDIVAESYAILKPGGVAVWVVKRFIRNGKIQPFDEDWRRLCEHVGFITIREVHASLVHRDEHDGLFGPIVKTTARKSFFRRLYESKRPDNAIDWETVYFMVKQ